MGSNSKRQQNLEVVSFSSVEQMPNAKGAALFITDSSKVFKDDIDIAPVTLTDGTQYMPWGGDNLMPYHILEMVEKDETLSTCQMFNAEVCYGSGLVYNTEGCTAQVKEEVEDFLLANSRTLSTSDGVSLSSSSTTRESASCRCTGKKCATAASRLQTRKGISNMCCMPTGTSPLAV